MHVNMDLFLLAPGVCAIGGWASEPAVPSLIVNGSPVPPAFSASSRRPDVNQSLGKDDDAERGFALIVRLPAGEINSLTLIMEGGRDREEIALDVNNAKDTLAPGDAGALGERGYAAARRLAEGANAALAQTVRCSLDTAVTYNDGTGNVLALCGWVIMPAGAELWLEDETSGFRQRLHPYYFQRNDVAAGYGVWARGERPGTGFAIMLEMPALAAPRLTARMGKLAAPLCNVPIEQVYGFIEFLRKPFTALVISHEVAQCHKQAYYPVLASLQRRRMAAFKVLPSYQGSAGEPLARPELSLIIPLYGEKSLHLMESQLMLFSEDADLLQNAELIYVLDDPALLDNFLMGIADLHRIYRVPFRYIYKNANQGFAAANNLGASIARAPLLLFLNSDVFPQRPGWLRHFREYFASHPKTGLVGSRLLAADGSIQHTGLRLRFHKALGIWTNDQPHAGLAPETMPEDLAPDMVTGACMAIPKKLFDSVDGWSEDYIMGDFEDSDLCLKVKAQGRGIAMLPLDCLVHLERQSFGCLGKTHFRHNLAIYNAVVHQEKWRGALRGPEV